MSPNPEYLCHRDVRTAIALLSDGPMTTWALCRAVGRADDDHQFLAKMRRDKRTTPPDDEDGLWRIKTNQKP